jgi:hypothetical protein
MQQNDINLQFKMADVAYFCYIFAHSFHRRQNLLWGGDKRSQKGEVNKNFAVIMENPPLADKISLVSC